MTQSPKFQIAPSILSADFARLGEEVTAVLEAGADLIHFDVMDNHYVPTLTVGPLVCQALRNYGITAPIDVHLMVSPVDDLIQQFIKAGASQISFHPEATLHIDRSLMLIKQAGILAGLALNPATPLSYLDHVLDKLDFILVMSVNPGFGGQQFIPSVLPKITAIRRFLQQMGHEIPIFVDGGIKIDNIRQVADAGADSFVMGSALFTSKDYRATILAVREQLCNK